ncbi:peptide-methionine (S)-S-oxide reductase MsrA [Metamycoplasma spumans]|uniref:peptide-methionine (S)-S-oxide reductase MsrA n=1 Tax=Metamycoplasma spumans TaxID=92406 RepID=UPI0034DDBF98
MKDIYIAGGCFWGVQWYLKKINGVLDTKVGYANSNIENPSYEQVKTSLTNAVETVYVKYDADIVSLDYLIKMLFKVVDPTSLNFQAEDFGSQYRNGIYYTDNEDYQAIEKSLSEVAKNYDKPIVTENLALQNFFLAEEYHQDYLDKNPNGYCHIKGH